MSCAVDVLTAPAPQVIIDGDQVIVEVPAADPVVIEVGVPGPVGPLGPVGPPGPIGPPGPGSDTFSSESDDTLVVGSPVYVKISGNLGLAQANAIPQTRVRGLAVVSALPGFSSEVQTQGLFVATTAEWDAITGQVGGLTVAASYYVDSTTPGSLSTTSPSQGSGEYCAFVGTALSSTELDIDIRTPIKRS